MAIKTPAAAGVEPIDRLEEKIKMLVTMIGRLKSEQARAADENGRLQREVDTLKARLSEAESTNAEVVSLREERDVIRSRVTEMLEQLEGLNL
jgi:regulator of replication initiation timing